MTPLRILHLEDNAADASLAAATLKGGGIQATLRRVETRAAFESALHADTFDVIIADYNLPAFDGVAAQVMAAGVCPDVPFIFLSGSIGEDFAVERLKAGATDYVLKDRMMRLPSAVQRALTEGAERAKRREAEQALHRLNAELEHRVAERTAELAAARIEADRANRAKSDFISRMSHDLRTPLNAVLGFAQLMREKTLDAEDREAVDQIMRGGRHLLDLVNEVLDIARIESGHLSLSLEPMDASEVVQQAVDLVRPLAARRRITLTAADARGVIVRADRQRLNQVLMNLLSNAVKYNRPEGSVAVSFEARDGTRRILVADTGPGIPPAKLALLFQPFERLGAEQTDIEGTGLGLALARRLAMAMGGTLGVDSRVDEGTTFWVELAAPGDDVDNVDSVDDLALPADRHAAGAGPAASEAAGVLLYVEDNASNVRLMQRIVQRRPRVRLLHGPTGDQGLQLARQERPNLIFLDMHLPDMSGEDVLRLLWQEPSLRDIPVAVLSADASPSHARRLETAGAIAYLTKPLDVPAVLRLLDERMCGVS